MGEASNRETHIAANRQEFAYATVTIEIKLHEEDEPLTQAEVDALAHTSSDWADWNVLNVGQKRDAPRTFLDGNLL